MTVRELLTNITAQLEQAGCDSPAFDALCLLEDIGGVGRGGYPAKAACTLSPDREAAVCAAADRRASGYPLQYLLGEWEFLRLRLRVGEGVLVPRPDTELLCETVAARLRQTWNGAAVRGLDLCAGSGCVALGIASLYPHAAIQAVELSDAALPYLRENCARYPHLRVSPVQADVLHDSGRFAPVSFIASNPPYIPPGDLSALMPEVRHEPRLALDGVDADGLRFYRAIAADWLPLLLPNGFCAVEVGVGQAAAVAALFCEHGLRQVEILPDLAGIDRVVVGQKSDVKQ